METAAHLADHVIPALPVRPWVLSVRKRLCYYLQSDPAVQNLTLHIFLSAVEQGVRRCSPGAASSRTWGATSPPRMAPASGPPLWEMADAGQDEYDPQAQPAPDYEFDQRIAW